MKPTPGPWVSRGGAVRPAEGVGSSGGYTPILSAQRDKRMPDNREANAKLAAAAPELLEALQWLLRQVPEPSLPGDYSTAYLAAKAAVHKATA